MTDKELRHLSKADLIEIIYQMKKIEEQLRTELATANEQLQKRELKIQKAGSIAEATLSLNGVFEAAQKAADEYLAQIQQTNIETETRCAQMIVKTETECREKCEAADKEVDAKWDEFQVKVQQMLRSHSELSTFLQQNKELL